MPTLLKNLRISFISLVPKGANGRKVVLKTAEGDPAHTLERPIVKADPGNQRIYSIVYAPDEVDAQGEYATAEEIEKAAYEFMKGLNALNVDVKHSFQPEGAFVAESWLVRKGDPLFPDEAEGAWAVGIKVEDPQLWQEVEKGGYQAVSMGGLADKIPGQTPATQQPAQKGVLVGEDEAGLIQKLLKALHIGGKQTQTEDTDMDEAKVKELIQNGIDEWAKDQPKPLTKEDLMTVVSEAMKPTVERLEKIEKQSPGTKQDPDEIKKHNEDLLALGAEIAKMVNPK